MQYIKPYTYFSSKSGGTQNLLWGSLCFFSNGIIPIIGFLIWMGYIVEVIRSLKRDPQIEDHPDFDINKFTHYLSLGIWPLVMNLILGLAFLFIFFLIFGVGFAIALATKEPVIGIIVGGVLYVPALLLMMMFIWPMTLHSQLRGALELGAALSFTFRFFKLVGGQALLSVVAHFFVAQFLMIFGLLLCCIGIYPAQAITSMAQEHFMVQLYRLYLDEGGEPIPEPDPAEEVTRRRKRRNDDEDDSDDEE